MKFYVILKDVTTKQIVASDSFSNTFCPDETEPFIKPYRKLFKKKSYLLREIMILF